MSLRLASQIIACTIFACGASVPLHAQDKGVPPVSPQALKAKFDYCLTCHGRSGQGFRGAVAMPRLAGLQPDYIESQLKAYAEHRRADPVMRNVAQALSPAMLTALATKFKELNPKPLGGRSLANDQIAAGKKIFDEGVPGKNVPACTACHGQDAKGIGPFPRLAGQLDDYVIKALKPDNPDSSAIMQPITRGLSEAQRRAVASYVSTLE